MKRYKTGYPQGDEFMSILARLSVMVRDRAIEACRGTGRTPVDTGDDTEPSAVISTLTSWPDPAKCAARATAVILRRSNHGPLRNMGALLKTVGDHPRTVSRLLPVMRRTETEAIGMGDDHDRLRMPRYLSHVFSRLLVGLVSDTDFKDGEIPARCAFDNMLLDRWSGTNLAPLAERLDEGSVSITDEYLDSMFSAPVADGMARICSLHRIPASPDYAILRSGSVPGDVIGELVTMEERMLAMTDTLPVSHCMEMLPLTMGTMRRLVETPPPEQAWVRAAGILKYRLAKLKGDVNSMHMMFLVHGTKGEGTLDEYWDDADRTLSVMAGSDWDKAPDADMVMHVISAFVPREVNQAAAMIRSRVFAEGGFMLEFDETAFQVDEVAGATGDAGLVPAACVARRLLCAVIDGGVREPVFNERIVRSLVGMCGDLWLPDGFVSETVKAVFASMGREDGRPEGCSDSVRFKDRQGMPVVASFEWYPDTDTEG